MRSLAYSLMIFAASIFVVLIAAKDPGYVRIVRPPWSFETSLSFFAALSALALLGLYISARLVMPLLPLLMLRMPRVIATWYEKHRSARQRSALARGLIALAGGAWHTAEDELVASLHRSEMPLVSFLALALAAQGRGDLDRRDEYIAKAHAADASEKLTIGVTQALLQIQARQREQALATLVELHKLAPEHHHVMTLLAETARELKDWTTLMGLIPTLRRHKVIASEKIDEIELEVHEALLRLSLPTGAPDVLKQAWGSLPSRLHKHPRMVALYADRLIEQAQHNAAETLLRETINHEWDEALVTRYGHIKPDNIAKTFETAKGWRTSRQQSAALALTLGRLALACDKTDQGVDYLKDAIRLGAGSEAHYCLGRALEQRQQGSEALASYRAGLESCLKVRGE